MEVGREGGREGGRKRGERERLGLRLWIVTRGYLGLEAKASVKC